TQRLHRVSSLAGHRLRRFRPPAEERQELAASGRPSREGPEQVASRTDRACGDRFHAGHLRKTPALSYKADRSVLAGIAKNKDWETRPSPPLGGLPLLPSPWLQPRLAAYSALMTIAHPVDK